MKRPFWLLRGLKFLIFAIVFLAVVGQFFMVLWNKLVPEIFNGPVISFWQGLGLLLLSRILFGGWGRGGGASWARRRNAWKQKIAGRMATMTPEEQEKFRQQMRHRCAPWGRRRFNEDPLASTTQP